MSEKRLAAPLLIPDDRAKIPAFPLIHLRPKESKFHGGARWQVGGM
jgi:hypothetical protein